jgi:heat shock protein HtpX
MTALLDALDERTAANAAAARRIGWQTAIAPTAIVAVVVGVVLAVTLDVVVGIVVGLLAGVGTAVLWVRPRATSAVERVLAAVGARPATEEEHPRYFNLVEGLSMSHGVAEPSLHVVDATGANALAVGAPGSAAVVVTTGLLEHLDRVELEGVLAQALYRIRVHEADLGAQAAVFVGGPLLRSGPAAETPLGRSAGRRAVRLGRLLEARDDFVADLSASAMTRYPPGLRQAFAQMAETGTHVPTSPWGAVFLWMCDPLGATPTPPDEAGASALRHHPPIQHRIDLLAEL